MTGPLNGLRVLDLTQVLAGPFCTMVLADLGADVIKIERPDGGDQMRRSWGRAVVGEDSRAFLAVNRNKRSVVIDLASPGGKSAFYDLVREADVVVESWRPGVAAALGVDYDTLSRYRADLIYASISGFGQDGPYANRPGYDLVAQAMGGLMSVSGDPRADIGKSALPVGDLGAGLYAVSGILAACLERTRSGLGQHVETSLFDAVVSLSVWESTELWTTGIAPSRKGTANRMAAPYEPLRTGDGYLVVAANNDRMWRALCKAIGSPQLVDDPRFLGNTDRLVHRAELRDELERVLLTDKTDHWVQLLLDAGVAAGPILDYQQVLDNDAHVAARNMVVEVDHPVEGRVKALSSALRFSRTPATVRTSAPLLGQDTDRVLGVRR